MRRVFMKKIWRNEGERRCYLEKVWSRYPHCGGGARKIVDILHTFEGHFALLNFLHTSGLQLVGQPEDKPPLSIPSWPLIIHSDGGAKSRDMFHSSDLQSTTPSLRPSKKSSAFPLGLTATSPSTSLTQCETSSARSSLYFLWTWRKNEILININF